MVNTQIQQAKKKNVRIESEKSEKRLKNPCFCFTLKMENKDYFELKFRVFKMAKKIFLKFVKETIVFKTFCNKKRVYRNESSFC